MRACLKAFRNSKPSLKLIRGLSSAPSTDKSISKPAKYPVPPLHKTLDKYLKSVKPFLSKDELCHSESIIKEFGKPGGQGEHLQQILWERGAKMDNWLEEWWLNTAYLQYRDPVVVFSSPGLVFPKQTFSTTEDCLKYAAKMIAGALDYKEHIDSDKIPVEKFGKNSLDMTQYKKIFGTCRIPGMQQDSLSFNPQSQHIIIACNNNFFRVDVKPSGGSWLKYDQILPILNDIIVKSCDAGNAIGLLTSEQRNNWANAYSELKSDPTNCEYLKDIEESLFILCLDNNELEMHRNEMTTTGEQLVHGGGPKMNAANRWYDKTIQFIVDKNGGNGLTYEHSPAEGQPIAVMMDHIVKYVEKAPEANCDVKTDVKKLCFKTNECINSMITTAAQNLTKLTDDMDFCCFSFNKFGKEELKKLKTSPDSFIQMALQYAFYKLHKEPGAHYESGSTRMFIGGRTETIRSCSEESVSFAKAMLEDKLTNQSKALALRVALDSHKQYVNYALFAEGVDRHLLGLKIIAGQSKMELPELYKDKAYIKSTYMRISTSQVASACDGFMVYGPLVKDGYACCYNPRSSNINFGTSAFKSGKITNVEKFKEEICSALSHMKELLEKVPLAKL